MLPSAYVPAITAMPMLTSADRLGEETSQGWVVSVPALDNIIAPA